MQNNWARSLRPTTFGQIVGQELVKSMLLNSLYLQRSFPAYLFAGQRGCGKTTMARLLARAVNCHKLSTFIQNPKQQGLPCLDCESCLIFATGQHPDFIELDAASNTGVDNIRQLLEGANFQPVLATKKIYLIDEAHMLSKAAFNALLKSLEEPNANVMFILATTELNKIPDTVRSRCFLGFFQPQPNHVIVDYLEQILKKHLPEIVHQKLALEMLAHKSQGSLRDALNLLEQTALAAEDKNITTQLVTKIIGLPGPEVLLAIWKPILESDHQALQQVLTKHSLISLQPLAVYESSCELLGQLFACRMQVNIINSATSIWQDESIKAQIQDMAKLQPLEELRQLWQHWWNQEEALLKTGQKWLFLEFLLYQACQKKWDPTTKNGATPTPLNNTSKGLASSSANNLATPKNNSFTKPPEAIINKAPTNSSNLNPGPQPAIIEPAMTAPTGNLATWQKLLQEPAIMKDRLLSTILQQVIQVKIEQPGNFLELTLSKGSPFFTAQLNESWNEWKGLAQKYWPEIKDLAIVNNVLKPSPTATVAAKPSPLQGTIGGPDIKDASKWPQASLLASHFPGKITEVRLHKDIKP